MFKPNLNPSHPIVFFPNEFKRIVFNDRGEPSLAVGGILVPKFDQRSGSRYYDLNVPGGASLENVALFASHAAERDDIPVVFSNGAADNRVTVDPHAEVEPLGRNDAYEVLGRFATIYGEARQLDVAQVLRIGALARRAMIDADAINDLPSR